MWGRIAGWVIAHKDALIAGGQLFLRLRRRRKETQETNESAREFYWRKARELAREKVAE